MKRIMVAFIIRTIWRYIENLKIKKEFIQFCVF